MEKNLKHFRPLFMLGFESPPNKQMHLNSSRKRIYRYTHDIPCIASISTHRNTYIYIYAYEYVYNIYIHIIYIYLRILGKCTIVNDVTNRTPTIYGLHPTWPPTPPSCSCRGTAARKRGTKMRWASCAAPGTGFQTAGYHIIPHPSFPTTSCDFMEADSPLKKTLERFHS